MNTLALDLGTKCGYACTCGASGVWCLKPKSHESSGQRYVRFKAHLDAHTVFCTLKEVVYEEVKYHRGTDAGHVYGGLEAILQAFCIDRLIEYRGIGVSTIQRAATGRGMAPKGKKKQMMFDAAVEKFKGINVINEDHADALWILHSATNQAVLTKS
jgi:crossover junction endodeoxyribonuclease RuvC